MTRDEVVLSHRVHRQPSPALHPGGDCGACVLGGLLGLDPAETYTRYGEKHIPDTITWWAMRDALYLAQSDQRLDRIVTQTPCWPWECTPGIMAFGPLSTMQSQAWWSYLRMALDAGYYGLTHVDHSRRGSHGPGPNHWVMLCGMRVNEPEIPPGAVGVRIRQEVLVSCSASNPEGEWVDLHDLLRERGAWEMYLARPVGR